MIRKKTFFKNISFIRMISIVLSLVLIVQMLPLPGSFSFAENKEKVVATFNSTLKEDKYDIKYEEIVISVAALEKNVVVTGIKLPNGEFVTEAEATYSVYKNDSYNFEVFYKEVIENTTEENTTEEDSMNDNIAQDDTIKDSNADMAEDVAIENEKEEHIQDYLEAEEGNLTIVQDAFAAENSTNQKSSDVAYYKEGTTVFAFNAEKLDEMPNFMMGAINLLGVNTSQIDDIRITLGTNHTNMGNGNVILAYDGLEKYNVMYELQLYESDMATDVKNAISHLQGQFDDVDLSIKYSGTMELDANVSIDNSKFNEESFLKKIAEINRFPKAYISFTKFDFDAERKTLDYTFEISATAKEMEDEYGPDMINFPQMISVQTPDEAIYVSKYTLVDTSVVVGTLMPMKMNNINVYVSAKQEGTTIYDGEYITTEVEYQAPSIEKAKSIKEVTIMDNIDILVGIDNNEVSSERVFITYDGLEKRPVRYSIEFTEEDMATDIKNAIEQYKNLSAFFGLIDISMEFSGVINFDSNMSIDNSQITKDAFLDKFAELNPNIPRSFVTFTVFDFESDSKNIIFTLKLAETAKELVAQFGMDMAGFPTTIKLQTPDNSLYISDETLLDINIPGGTLISMSAENVGGFAKAKFGNTIIFEREFISGGNGIYKASDIEKKEALFNVVVINPDNSQEKVENVPNGTIINVKFEDGSTIKISQVNGQDLEITPDPEIILTIPTWSEFVKWEVVEESDKTLSLIAVLKLKDYTITATSGENGSISPSGVKTVNHEDVAKYLFTANPGYKVLDVKVNNVSVGAISEYTFSGVDENQTISVEFTEVSGGSGNKNYYSLKFNVNGGNKLETRSYKENSKVELNMVSSRLGYTFEGWYLDSSLTQKVSSVYMDGNKTVYAKWDTNVVEPPIEPIVPPVNPPTETVEPTVKPSTSTTEPQVNPQVDKEETTPNQITSGGNDSRTNEIENQSNIVISINESDKLDGESAVSENEKTEDMKKDNLLRPGFGAGEESNCILHWILWIIAAIISVITLIKRKKNYEEYKKKMK